MRKLSILMAALSVTAAAMTYDCTSAPESGNDAAVDEMELARLQAERRWVDSIYNMLTPRQKVAQLFVPHLVIKDNQAGRDLIKRYVAGDGVGGLLLGSGDIMTYARLNNYAQSLARVPLMITADAEWGLSMRLSDAPRFPHNIAIGATTDTAAVAAYGREMARECLALGITVSFAPDADVNSNPDNPIIGYRSFGEDPQRVAELSAAYARGLEEGGVLAVAKHFPGHGDTSTDSHKTLPTVNRTKGELEKVELVPFQRLVKSGIGGVMIGHVKVPALDKSGTPASLSRKITTDLLKKKMGFDGLVFTDALEMAGAQVKGANNCVLALRAGADVLLGSRNPSVDIDSVMRAMRSGRLDSLEVYASVRKLLCYKFRLGLEVHPKVDLDTVKALINNDDAHGVDDRLARASITVLRNDAGLLPRHGNSKVAVVEIGQTTDKTFVGTARRMSTQVEQGGAETTTRFSKTDAVLAPVYSSNAAAVSRLAALRKSAGDKLVPVFFMNPYKVSAFAGVLKGLPTVVIAGDDTPALRKAAAEAVFGAEDVDGRLSVSVKGVGNAGDGLTLESTRLGRSLPAAIGAPSRLTSQINALIDKGLDERAFTGCQVMVIKDGEIIYDRSAGTIDGGTSAKVTSATLFDLASVSKVAGTMMGLMAAYDRGMFKLDDKLSKFIPELKGDPKGDLTMRQLMLHQTGLPSTVNPTRIVVASSSLGDKPLLSSKKTDVNTIPIQGLWGNRNARLRGDIYSAKESENFDLPVGRGLFASEAAADTIMSRVYDLKQGASKDFKYSDVNFLLLMEAEERMTGKSHDEWVDETVYAPLGIKRMVYRPTDLFELSEIAATEDDPLFRRQKIHGYVHDETAAFMGGVAGNAGLFSNAESLAVLCQMLLDGGSYDGRRIFSQKTVEDFLTPRSGSRGLGFDTASGGKFIGHTGFTGTCFWIDPRRELTVVILTNRVNPSRDNKAWNRLNFRTKILETVSKCF